MPLRLTETQLREYHDNGFTAPVRVFSEAEGDGYPAQAYGYEAAVGKPVDYPEKSKCHLLFNWADAIVHHPAVLDAVEDVIGPDILLFHFTLPTKEVTAWVALSEASELSGCMRMIPGSHKIGIAAHADTTAEGSIIRRVQ